MHTPVFFFFYDSNVPVFRKELRTFERALEYVSERKSNLSTSNLRLLIYIANNIERILSQEGMTLMAIAKELNAPYGTLSRQIDLLSEGYSSFEGLGFVERGLDKDNPKMRRIKLTEDGIKFIRGIESIMVIDQNPLTESEQ